DRPLERILQPLVALVDAHGPLQRRALRRRALGGEAVRMGLALQRLPAFVDRGAVLLEPLRQPEEFEVAVAQVHCQTRKLSPQPQRSRCLGLWKLEPSFGPSRTKSGSGRSM